MALLEASVVVGQYLAHAPRVADHVVLFVCLDRTQRGRAAERMAVVSQTAVENFVVEVGGDLRTHAYRAKRHVAAGQALGQGDEVGHHVPMVDCEPSSGPAEA